MGDWKLIVDGGADDVASTGKKKGKKADGKYEQVALYHLAADPAEAKNLAAAEPERVKAMRTRLAELLKDAVPSGVR
jgi:arylsulfatase A-like enzyme